MRKLLCTFLMALLTLTVFAQDDNIRRPPKKPVKQQQWVTTGLGKPSKPSKQTTSVTQSSESINPSKPAISPTESTTSNKPIAQSLEVTPASKPTMEQNTSSKPITSKPTTGTVNGYEWVDLGLSVKWATMNVGASSPSDNGGYYAWGETSTKSHYDLDNYFDCMDNKGNSWGTYKLGGQTCITPSSGHDTARENWGGTWRMPTDAENEELCKKCKWTWISQDGYKGYIITGPNGNSIFLPAAGWRSGTSTYGGMGDGNYWSSTLSSSNPYEARDLYFGSGGHKTFNDGRRNGQSVRPVTE